METKDLRLGNYVNVPRADQSPFRIDLFEYLHSEDCKVGMNVYSWTDPNFGKINGHPLTWHLKDLSPIPLTEEWLLRFGFEYKSEKHSFSGWYSTPVLGESIRIFPIENGWYKYYSATKVTKCVHQLQNLYFALTGEELTLTP